MSDTPISPATGSATLAGGAAGNWPSTGTFFCTLFSSLLVDSKSGSIFPRCPAIGTQTLPFSAGVPVTGPPFTNATRLARLHSTAACLVSIGDGAPAWRLAPNVSELFAVNPSDAVSVVGTT